MTPVRGVILDVDGTLIDSNDAHAQAWVDAMAEAGVSVPFSKVRRLIGMGGDKLLPTACGFEEDTAEGKRISERRKQIIQSQFLPKLQPFPQAQQLLERMRAEGLTLVVASSAKKDELTPLLQLCGGDKLIKSSPSSDDAEHSKPDPDIVEVALKELDVANTAALMLGDTPYDISAAHKAGVRIVAFRCGGWTDANLGNAVAVYENPADLLAHYEDSPFARGLE